jgi:hypothetical protein
LVEVRGAAALLSRLTRQLALPQPDVEDVARGVACAGVGVRVVSRWRTASVELRLELVTFSRGTGRATCRWAYAAWRAARAAWGDSYADLSCPIGNRLYRLRGEIAVAMELRLLPGPDGRVVQHPVRKHHPTEGEL